MKVFACANDGVVCLHWLPKAKIVGCLGFAITRIDVATKKEEVLGSYIPFKGETNPDWKSKPTTVWPVQKCSWMDYVGKAGKQYKYRVTPMVGEPGNLRTRKDLGGTSNKVKLTTQIGSRIKVAFTRGILSTQALARQLPTLEDGSPDFNVLIKAIQTPGDPIRKRLAGNALELLLAPITRARREGGDVLLALYELADPEVIDHMKRNLNLWSLILSNTGKDDETNAEVRKALHELGAAIIDRMLKEDSAIGHNKTQVYRDKRKKPRSVTTGSTNITATGLTCQSNNVITIESNELAQIFADYYEAMRLDDAKQSAEFRTCNANGRKEVVLGDGKTRITVWFAPNTKERVKPSKNAPTPPDMQEVFDLMDRAKKSIHFLAFYPGFPSIISKVQELYPARPELLIRGAVSSPAAMPRNRIIPRKGELPPLVCASGIEKAFADWRKELLKLPDAHAVIHDKVVAIDVMAEDEADCVIILGSHNLGFKASYSNDENMIIIRGNRQVALAYLTHILDVYNHYRFRSAVWAKKTGFSGYLSLDDKWLDKYITGPARKELEYWFI
jgi:hypothetical protein